VSLDHYPPIVRLADVCALLAQIDDKRVFYDLDLGVTYLDHDDGRVDIDPQVIGAAARAGYCHLPDDTLRWRNTDFGRSLAAVGRRIIRDGAP
jgi:hypothetical protein